MIGFDPHPVLDAMDLHLCVSSQQLVHHAFKIGRQMLDDDKGHAGVRRQILKKLFE
jgi:hypothetical protein